MLSLMILALQHYNYVGDNRILTQPSEAKGQTCPFVFSSVGLSFLMLSSLAR